MIELPEHNFKAPQGIERYAEVLGRQNYVCFFAKERQPPCFRITYQANNETPYRFETAYFVGVDWIVENKLPICVKPKLDNETAEVDYLRMLSDILQDPANYEHLDQLYTIRFEKPPVPVQQKQDLLTPFLLIQYLNILQKIVRKGLKKSYYPVVNNLNARIKGKILVNETFKKNRLNHQLTRNYCRYQEFGINSVENRLLKKALTFSVAAIQNIKGIEKTALYERIRYIRPSFAQVGDEVDLEELKSIKPDKIYREYEQALRLARHILRRYGYNISSVNAEVVHTPPFWIDMSKLFELYVYAKLRERFPKRGEVIYHRKLFGQVPDFIIKTQDGNTGLIADAKYKPQYKEDKVSTEDIRQLSGYARIKKAYEILGMSSEKVIDCLIIYSHQQAARKDFKGDNFKMEEEPNYIRFFKIGIQLPVKI